MAERKAVAKPAASSEWETVSGGEWETVAGPAPVPPPQPSAEQQFRSEHPYVSEAADVGEGLMNAPVTTAIGGGKAALKVGYHIARAFGLPKNEDYEKMIEPDGVGENIGAAVANTIPFVAGDAPIASAAAKVPRLVSGLVKAAGRFTVGDLVARAEGDEHPEITGGLNATLPILFDAIGGGLKKLGIKFQTSQIRPNDANMKAGYVPENLNKYGLSKLTFEDGLTKTHEGIVARANELRDITQAANDAAPAGPAAEGLASAKWNPSEVNAGAHREAVADAIKAGKSVPPEVIAQYPELANAAKNASIAGPKVDLSAALDAVESKVLSRAKQLQLPADEIDHVKSAINTYRKWATNLPEGGAKLTIDEAQTAKRAIGLKGAWEYNKTAADSGMEKVSNELYNVVKAQVEEATNNVATQAGEKAGRVKQINNELGDLMPIEQAMIRRLPVKARNNPLSLTDLMLFATGHPIAGLSHVLSRTMAGATATYAAGKAATATASGAGNVAAGVSSTMGAARKRLREAQ